jgi:hypothetical protein
VPLGLVRALTFAYGAGLGFANTPLVIAVQTSVPWGRRGVATASTMFFRTIGGTLAVGLLGGVLTAKLAGSGAPADVVDRMLGPERLALDPAALAGVAAALQSGLGLVFWVVCAVALGAAAASFLFPRVPVSAGQGAGPRDQPAPPSPGESAGAEGGRVG